MQMIAAKKVTSFDEDVPHQRANYLPFGKPNFADEEVRAVERVLRSGWIGMGEETLAFEKELSQYLEAPYVVTVNSCTSSLFLSLLLHDIGKDDEVICPSLTWCSTANTPLYLKAKTIFCDIDPETLCMSPESIGSKLSARTKAVIVVHFGGLAVDIKAIRSVLPAHVAIIEDAAHALGSRYSDGRPVGSSGNLTNFSFYANKNLSTGEGGAIALFDHEWADRLRSLRQNGTSVDAWQRFANPKSMILTAPNLELGYKMNFTDLQASIGRVQLRRQAEFDQNRLSIARYYHEQISKHLPKIQFQTGCISPNHARHLFVIKLPLEEISQSRNEVILAMRERNIGATVHYAPLHRVPLYETTETLPSTEHISQRLMTLPISADMTLSDARDVIDALVDVLDS
jgi:dTDP-4-amino-4,6-dideoxygalactose transaminase